MSCDRRCFYENELGDWQCDDNADCNSCPGSDRKRSADLPEAGASAERISSVIYSPAMTVEFNCKKCGEKVVREKVSEDAMKIGYYKRLFKWCDKCRREWERSALKRLPVVLDAIGRDCI